MSVSFKVISTFSGCGGSSLGYQLAGGKVLLAVEWDANAVATYKLNFPGTPVHAGDIGKLSAAAVLELASIAPGELDVFDGSPPCQGFSTSGKRNFGDARNQLFQEYCRLLQELRAKVFVMENVAGLVMGKMKFAFVQILRALKGCGYKVRAKLLNAKFYGVPQSRQRLIFIGVREDLGIEPSFPAPITAPLSARAALIGVENDPAELAMLLEAGRKHVAYKYWHQLKPGQNYSKIHPTGSYFNGVKVHPDKPSCTIRKSDGNIGMHGMMHWSERRRFTSAEFKRFAGFPDNFKFVGTWSDAVQRIGNCVPPKFMKAIADHIRDAILAPIAAAGGVS